MGVKKGNSEKVRLPGIRKGGGRRGKEKGKGGEEEGWGRKKGKG